MATAPRRSATMTGRASTTAPRRDPGTRRIPRAAAARPTWKAPAGPACSTASRSTRPRWRTLPISRPCNGAIRLRCRFGVMNPIVGGSIEPLQRHPAGIGCDQIARAHGGIAADIDARDAEAVLAVAGALGHDARAVDEGVFKRAVAAAVAGDGAADIAAGENLGRARGAKRVAKPGCCGGTMVLDREVPSVAQPHAVGHGPTDRRAGALPLRRHWAI